MLPFPIPRSVYLTLAALAVVIALRIAVGLYGDARYDAGVEATAKTYREIVAKKDAENRKTEAELKTATEAYEKERKAKAEVRVGREQVLVDRLTREIDQLSAQCRVSPDFLSDRNRMRELGPE